MNLHNRVADHLGWSVDEVKGFSLHALRDIVLQSNPKLAYIITQVILDGHHLTSHVKRAGNGF